MRRAISMLLLSLASCSALADELTTGILYSYCKSRDASVRKIGSMYIVGVVQGLSLSSGLTKDREHFCIPDDLSEEQMVGVFLRTAGALSQLYPKDMDLPAVSIVAASMKKEFPCAKLKN